ncbi:hypothetical protein SCOCK_10282 [Actinacidiphila cocklensis]|uniref:Uncharacterized protein n=1 Tax=Actinacidiphila cocklensis TaxID=887465 RepID=A0A9W4DNT5_9ACTN|nr:hypothetical protein SCOCK_10282 [Actinacidiphila cocklensis]
MMTWIRIERLSFQPGRGGLCARGGTLPPAVPEPARERRQGPPASVRPSRYRPKLANRLDTTAVREPARHPREGLTSGPRPEPRRRHPAAPIPQIGDNRSGNPGFVRDTPDGHPPYRGNNGRNSPRNPTVPGMPASPDTGALERGEATGRAYQHVQD